MPLIGDSPSVDIPLWVPGSDSDLTPLAAAFIMTANTTLTQMQRVLSRMRSQVLYTDKFQAGANWIAVEQKLRIIGETWGYLELTLQRTKSKLPVPDDGNFTPVTLGAIADADLVPQSLSSLSSTKQGRAATGHVLSSGEVKLDSINNGDDIAIDEIITLAGPFPLDNWIDSEV